MKLACAIALCLGLATACAAPPVEERGCKSTVKATVAPLGVTAAEVDAATISTEANAGEDNHTVGYTYWIRPKACSAGYLVVDVTTFCYVQQVYTSGDCQISGVKHY